MRKILITNDDGINSDGIVRLARSAKKLGEVWVVAPKEQCSAMSHRITIREPIDVFEADFPVEGVHAYATTATPGDCVRFGILNIIKEKPDVILSGINFGYNSGNDIQYSATVGAAMEGASRGVLSIAVSEGADGVHEVCDEYLDRMLEELVNKPLDYNQIWNLNFPECKLSDFKGILYDRKVSRRGFYEDHFDEEPIPGGLRLHINGIYQTNGEEGSDFKALVDNYISVGIVNNYR